MNKYKHLDNIFVNFAPKQSTQKIKQKILYFRTKLKNKKSKLFSKKIKIRFYFYQYNLLIFTGLITVSESKFKSGSKCKKRTQDGHKVYTARNLTQKTS